MENAAAAAGSDATGAGAAIVHVGCFRSDGAAGGTAVFIQWPADFPARGPDIVWTNNAARRAFGRKYFFAASPARAPHPRRAQPHLSRPSRWDFADALSHRDPT